MTAAGGVRLILVPYDSGQRGARMGRGPEYLVSRGAVEALLTADREVDVECVEAPDGFRAEIGTSFAIYEQVGERVAAALQERRLPIVLSGNCGSALGTLAALGPASTGVVWLDAHGDFNTPETSPSGFLDGMGLAIAVGHCWQPMRQRLWARRWGDDAVLPESRVVHVGGRDFDAAEAGRFERSAVSVVSAARVRSLGAAQAVVPALDRVMEGVDGAYVHVDLDVLDPAEAPANELLSRDGLSTRDVFAVIAAVAERTPIRAAALSAYDPAVDPEGKTVRAAIRLLGALAATHDASGAGLPANPPVP